MVKFVGESVETLQVVREETVPVFHFDFTAEEVKHLFKLTGNGAASGVNWNLYEVFKDAARYA